MRPSYLKPSSAEGSLASAAIRALFLVLFATPLVTGCGEQQRDDAPAPIASAKSDVYTEIKPSPGGTGKVYMGREMPMITEPPDAAWLDRTSREAEEHTYKVAMNLELEPADVVADIGAGTGFFTFRINSLVPEGKVIAVDIDPEMIDIIERRKEKRGAANVETVLGAIDNPNLPERSIDVALIVDTYTAFSHPAEMMAAIVKAMKPGARLFLIEYRQNSGARNPLRTIAEAQARKEIEAAGLQWAETKDILPQQHFLVFIKPRT